jgi:hypothetical protein
MKDAPRPLAQPPGRLSWRQAVPLAGLVLACAGSLAMSAGDPTRAEPRLDAPTTYHVATSGSDANPGTPDRPFLTVQKAVTAVEPGDTIRVHAGTYEGVVEIRRSGTRTAPIVLTGAGDGMATLVADFPRLDCSERAPTRDRTVQIVGGVDYWTLSNLSIVGGLLVMAPRTQVLKNRVFTDRTLPGHGAKPDPTAAERVLPQLGIDPSDGIRLIGLDLRGRGLLTIAARHGELASSRIHDIDCGTGAAVWLNRFSSFWSVHDNDVRDVAASGEHYMSEGIRLGSGSSYGVVEHNVVEHLQGPGRGITADVGASWNVYRANRVADTAVNFSEQAAGWGNQYLFNVSHGARRAGYQVYGVGGMDEAQRQDVRRRRKGIAPGKEGEGEASLEGSSTPRYLVFRCNDSQGDPVSFQAGDMAESTFVDNNFSVVKLSDKLRGDWDARGNLWNGGKAMPQERSSTTSFASCSQTGT